MFRSSFPSTFEETGFRTQAWVAGKAAAPDELKPLHDTMLHAFAAAARLEDEVGITVLPERRGGKPVHISYRKLYHTARKVAHSLADRDVGPGDRVLLVLPTGVEFLATFFAVQLIGAIAVPSYPPSGLRMESGLRRVAHIAEHAGAKICVAWDAVRPIIGDLALRAPGLRSIVSIEELLESSPSTRKYRSKSGDLAFIQYTSGSNGQPKGVALSQGNLVANCHAIGEAAEITRNDRVCGWCPLYHDMGLIGQVLFSVYWRLPLVLMSPTAFLANPSRWLWAMHEYRATMSTAPNFGYALAVKRVTEAQREGLDLSSWRLALNGAEPVNVNTLNAFLSTYAPHGFSRRAFLPVYGLAEVSLAAAFPGPGEEIVSDAVDRGELANGHAIPAPPERAMNLVSVGRAVPGHSIMVVDEHGQQLPEREVGHLVVGGPSVMAGYYGNKEATDSVIRGGWLWTGDLGYVADGNLFVTGRAKDLIILRGKNFYAEDLEQCAEVVDGARAGGCVAFGVYSEDEATELVVMVIETLRTNDDERMSLVEQVNEAVADACGVQLDEVVLVPPGTIPKTSSGKRQRNLCRELYLKDQLRRADTGKLYLVYVFMRSKIGYLLMHARNLVQRRREPD